MNSTGNDLESNDILDFEDNCENLDVLMNADQDYWTDRLGNKRPTIDYGLRMAGFTPAGFDFTTGGVLKNGDRNKCVFNQADQTWYSWSGDLPYNVIAGSTPGEGWKVVVYTADFLSFIKPVTWSGFAGGADSSGNNDSSNSFQAAVMQTKGQNVNPSIYNSVPTPDVITLRIPTGKYKINKKISPKGKLVIWLCDSGVEIDNHDNLCGKIIQNGLRHNAITSGILDNAVGFSVSVNRGLGKPAAIQGITDPSNLSSVTERDAVGFYADCGSRPPNITVAMSSYTATKALPNVPVDTSSLVRGMIIDTDNGYAGVVDHWAEDGKEITVSKGWYKTPSNTGPEIPPNAGFRVNDITKIWAHNANLELVENANTTRAAGFELGLRNSKNNFTDPDNTTDYMWGYDVVGFGPYNATVGFIQRTGVLRGFESSGALKEGYVVTKRGGVFPTTAIGTRCNSFEQLALRPNGIDSCFKVINTGDVDIGGQVYPGTRSVRMRSSGLNNDFDTRFQSIGGGEGSGLGTFRVSANFTEVTGGLRPVTTNASPCGTSSNAWSGGHTQTAFIVTSDENEKTSPEEITDDMLDAAGEVDWCLFQYLDSVKIKGEDGARWHFGGVAQRFVEAFKRHHLDPFKYAFICYDKWEDEYELVQVNEGEWHSEIVTVEEPVRTERVLYCDGTPLLDQNGEKYSTISTSIVKKEIEITVPDEPVFEKVLRVKAGERYGIRYDQAIILKQKQIERDHNRLISALEARISALENK
ncbi:putative tailspike protein [Aeromonas phage AVP1]|nr:putative tailspike protein [Aeromonas phage AVP1]